MAKLGKTLMKVLRNESGNDTESSRIRSLLYGNWQKCRAVNSCSVNVVPVEV